MTRRDRTVHRVNCHIRDLCENFDHYVQVFNDDCPFKMSAYTRALALIRHHGLRNALISPECLLAIRETLVEWKLNTRKNKLVGRDMFVRAFQEHKRSIICFENTTIADVDSKTADRLWEWIREIKLSHNEKSDIVAVSKALHHLLPQLIPPIDREYTGLFFSSRGGQFQDERFFKRAMLHFAEIAQRVDLSQYICRSKWATNSTKVIDNAIIGFGKEHRQLCPKPKCCASVKLRS